MPMSNYLRDAHINFFDRNDADTFTPPATLYVALWTATLDADSTGATAGEVSGGGGPYARQSITYDDPAGSGDTDNSATITFTGMPDATVTDWCIVDSSSGAGNIHYYKAFPNSFTVTSGNDLVFSAGDLDLAIR